MAGKVREASGAEKIKSTLPGTHSHSKESRLCLGYGPLYLVDTGLGTFCLLNLQVSAHRPPVRSAGRFAGRSNKN